MGVSGPSPVRRQGRFDSVLFASLVGKVGGPSPTLASPRCPFLPWTVPPPLAAGASEDEKWSSGSGHRECLACGRLREHVSLAGPTPEAPWRFVLP